MQAREPGIISGVRASVAQNGAHTAAAHGARALLALGRTVRFVVGAAVGGAAAPAQAGGVDVPRVVQVVGLREKSVGVCVLPRTQGGLRT